ncbi:MAG: T9SS type A sorting domain-containing protein [Lewinellaceae bacterium]|nr:T9SS type A sorting domain-containing protein [Saprospiraceae bacterium]MCB9336961.1 T9SS type A sorting domain-containing protein [Lewinellaceae bacterium]
MKIKLFTLYLATLFVFTSKSVAQPLDESTLPPGYFDATDPGLQAWEAYFQENYFSKGIPADSLCEGTGYLPYLRAKRHYDLRKDYLGDAGEKKRWEVFKEIRSRTLDRNGGPLPAADWQNLGPNKMEGQGGRMISHAFDPANPQVIWAGSASGGLWLSENGGNSWQPMTDQIPSTGVGAVAVNPLNPNSLLIGTGEGYAIGTSIRPGLGVFKSTDRGLMWEQSDFAFQHAAGVSAFKIAWSHADTNIVWLAATNGIWKSTDAGLTWSLKKGDGTNQNTAICDDIVQHSTDPGLLLAAIESDGIWRSTDGGEHWSKLGGGLPTTDLNFINLDICKSQPDVLYASIASGQATGYGLRGLYRTDDFGDNWVKIQNAPNALCSPQVPNGPCQGWYDNVVAVSPTDPDVVWLGGVTLWRSTNGGNTWVERDRLTCPNCAEPPACRTYVDQHDFAFDPSDPLTVYAFNDGGVAKSTDGGDCFFHKNEGLFTGQLYAIAAGRSDPGTVIGGTQDHGLQGVKLSENTNLAWDRWGFLDGSDVEVHATNANILYGGWINGTYWRTNSGVHNLASQITNGINLAENSGFYFAILRQHPTAPLTLLGATQQRLYKTTNGGNTWSPVATMTEPRLFEFDQADPDFAYAAAWSFNGTWSFWRSENGGDTWAQTSGNPGWRVTDIKSSPMQQGLVYVSRNSSLPNTPHIYKSDNHGDTWTPIQGDLPDLPVNAIAVHHFLPGVLFAATDLGVFVTCDDGDTWTEYNDNLPVTIALDIAFNPADTTLLIGTMGRGAWRTRAWMPDEPSATEEAGGKPSFGFANISPNPASTAVRIQYFLDKTADVRVEVVNVLGQKVAVLFSGKMAGGEHEAVWDGMVMNGLRAQAGAYFVRLRVGDEATTAGVVWR